MFELSGGPRRYNLLIGGGYLGTAALPGRQGVPSWPRGRCDAAGRTSSEGTPWRRPLLDKAPPCCGPSASRPRRWTASTGCRCCRARPSGPRRPRSGQPGPDTPSPRGRCRLFQKLQNALQPPSTCKQDGDAVVPPTLTRPVAAMQGASVAPGSLVATLRVPAGALLVHPICLGHISLSDSQTHSAMDFFFLGQKDKWIFLKECEVMSIAVEGQQKVRRTFFASHPQL